MRIKYNAPATLTFALICAVVLLLTQTVLPTLTSSLFVVGGKGSFVVKNPLSWIRLFTHVIGHSDWNHLVSNLTFILLLGPILEQSYGSALLFGMMVITALVTGVMNILLFPTALMGASGIVFMMILLASFTNFGKGEVPLTFILILCLFLGKEILNSFKSDNISEFAHIAGGFCGSLFGFLRPRSSGV